MFGYNSLKKDMDKLYQIQRDSDTKISEFKQDCQRKVQQNELENTVLKNAITHNTNLMNTLLDTFKDHDSKEMLKYGVIEDKLETINHILLAQETTTKNHVKEIEVIKANQVRFNRYIIWGTAIITTLGALAASGMWILDLLTKVKML